MAKAVKPSAAQSSSYSLPSGVSGITGASIGTLVVSLAKNLPESNSFKSWLVIAAPTIAICISWAVKKIERLFRKKKLKELYEKLKEEIETSLQNPALTEPEKENLRRKLTEIDVAKIETLAAKIKSMNADIDGV